MNAIVFLGPTLPHEEATTVLPATYVGPVSQGDVLRAVDAEPWAIGIVDGYFERVPAVWHKEILFALSRGIHVYGASSMGALRAAELSQYGMLGVGRIYDSFEDGTLEADDEVTIVHAPPEFGYRPLSAALVDLRSTIAAASREGIVDEEARESLVDIAQRLHYTERTYERVLAEAADRLPGETIARLETWLPEGRVDQKRLDAIEMLGCMREHFARDPAPHQSSFHFEHTDAWEQVRRRAGRQEIASFQEDAPVERLLDELRLQPELYGAVSAQANARTLALAEADRAGDTLDIPTFRDAVNEFRLVHDLTSPESIAAWIEENDLDHTLFGTIMHREALIGRVRERSGSRADDVLDVLRLTGHYTEIRDRAARKQRSLDASGRANPGLEPAPVNEDELLQWFFVERRGGSEAPPADIAATRMGFPDRDALIQSLLREYYFVNNRDG